MKKIFLYSLIILLTFQVKANCVQIDKTITNSGINKSAIAISVKDINTGKTVYQLNAKTPSIPASTLKTVTLSASLDTLGNDYKFSTKLYKSANNDLYLKLGADPFLTSTNLNKLFETASNKKIIEPKNIYIDDYIFDNTEWGEGWQWDDDLNPLMPKFTSYNIDKNLLNIIVAPTQPNAPANIYTEKFYPVTFMNLVTTGNYNNVKFCRNNSISPNIITAEGTVKKQLTKQIPINHMKRYFILRLEDAVKNAKIEYYDKFLTNKLPDKNIYLVSEISHDFNEAIDEILKQSNNFVAETVFKLAGAKFTNTTGTLNNSQLMLNKYFEKKGLNPCNIKITDGSGVSKNNIMTADFMTEFLVKENSYLKDLLPTAGEGTLSERMLYFKDNLRAKTGTLSDVSAIAGYITSRSGKTYAFDIMINDPKSKSCEKKSLEEYIIRDIYTKF